MATTFRALADEASFEDPDPEPDEVPGGDGEEDEGGKSGGEGRREENGGGSRGEGVLTLRHDVHIHLPITEDIKVYDAIFRSVRDTLLP